ncbi:outer membrane protein assembly factor BamB family protein [Actinocorallia populi]|uniref:outer membrane protein assembly factor BamB family protein n=1 Tax=Actinocorallia populi TaxID=2079200 RepID=UPI0013006DCD|nr:PQQ-binding-like beta-propeller repeat protein [Actinocorallia populi]
MSFIVFAVLLVAGILLAALNLEGAKSGEVGGLGCVVMVVALLLGGVAGYGVGDRSRDARMVPAWEIEADLPASLEGKGMWMAGDSVVRVRSDGAVAYGMDGRVRWKYGLQGAQVVCMMSPNAGGGAGVGLIGYAEEDKPCRQVVALDTATGKVLWKRVLGEFVHSFSLIGVLAVASEAAVLPAADGVRAFDPRSGKELWKARAKRGCAFEPAEDELGISAGRLAVVWRCKKRVLLESIDVTTGKPIWSVPVPGQRKIETVSVLSAEPAVIRVREKGEGGDDRILAFTGDAEPSGVIPVTGREGRIPFDDPSFPLVHGMSVQVRNGMIYALRDRDRDVDNMMTAYGLDGRPLWSRTWDMGQVDAFSVQDDGIVLVYEGYKGHPDRVTVLDLRTGEDTSSHHLYDNSYYFGSFPAWTHRHHGLTLVATPASGSPLVAYRKDKD